MASPYHIPTVGTAYDKLKLSGDDGDFIMTVKKAFLSHQPRSDISQQGKQPTASRATADRICRLLRWIRKEDYLGAKLPFLSFHLVRASLFSNQCLFLTLLRVRFFVQNHFWKRRDGVISKISRLCHRSSGGSRRSRRFKDMGDARDYLQPQ